jgi:FtsP/CotA-like multicopper oxidase with cupredoxin domain
MPEDVRRKVEADIKNGLKLTSFIAHADIAQAELTGPGQTLVFSMDESVNPTIMQVDGQPFDPSRLDRQLILGQAEEWTLSSGNSGHPYHIHVNPFQIVAIYDPTGKDVSDPNASEADGDTQYPGLKGQWKDTLWIKNAGKDSSGTYKIVVRTRYERYIGDFVLHCHILDHEDKGMMQNVSITLPDSGHPH